MWERVEDAPIPAQTAKVTTAVWRYPGVMILGVMRATMIGPPCIWATVLQGGLRNLRLVPRITDEFQRLIYSPTIYAETEEEYPRHAALLRYAGFHELEKKNGRVLFERSI